MNDKNQNNNSSPDYSFIMNQPAPGAQHQKKDKRVLLIFGLLGMLIIVIGVGFALRVKDNVVANNNQDVSGLFMNYVSTNQDDKAFALLSAERQKALTGSTFANSVGSPFRKYVDFSSCSKTTVDANKVNYTCKSALNGTKSVTISMELTNNKSGDLINTLTWSLTNG